MKVDSSRGYVGGKNVRFLTAGVLKSSAQCDNIDLFAILNHFITFVVLQAIYVWLQFVMFYALSLLVMIHCLHWLFSWVIYEKIDIFKNVSMI